MRRLECARPMRTATGQARNAGEAVQQLAHIARERQRLGQERKALLRRTRKIEARLASITALESRLMPLLRQQMEGGKTAPPPVRQRTALPLGLNQVTLQY
jgi:hypothetical protein